MKKMQKILISLLLVFALAGLPAAEILAASYDVSGELSSTILYPGDSLTGIGEGMTLKKDGAEISVEGGSWTNTSEDAYKVTKGDNVIELSKVETAQETTAEENEEEAQNEEGASPEEEAAGEVPAEGEEGAPAQGEEGVPAEGAESGQEEGAVPDDGAEPVPEPEESQEQPEAVQEPETEPVVVEENEPAEETELAETTPVTYLLTVQYDTGTDADQVSFENHEAGEEISISADDLTDEGFVFEAWELDSMNVEEGDLSAEVIQFSMPERDVTITAAYSEIEEETETEAETETETEAESETETETETETEIETETESESEPETLIETVPETELEAESESDADMGLMTLAATGLTIEVENGELNEEAEYDEKSGSYTFVVSADEPEDGYSFSEWTAESKGKTVKLSGDVSEEEGAELSVTGVDDGDTVVVTATYTTDEENTYEVDGMTIIVEGGKLDEDPVLDGDEYIIVATADDRDKYAFTNWTATIDGSPLALNGEYEEETSAELRFSVTDVHDGAEIIVTANFERVYEVIITGGYTSDGSDLTYFPGDDVSLTVYATLDDSHEFSYWDLKTDPDLDGDFLETVKGFDCYADPVTLTFPMPEADVLLMAVIDAKETDKQTENPVSYLYRVTVENGYADKEEYYAGETVTITSDYPETDMEFNVWTTSDSDVSFANSTRATTTFIMPENDVYVAATYKNGPVSYIEGIEEGATYASEEKLTFTPVGGGMDNTDPNPGDIRYVPTSYQIGNVSNSWTSAPYTTSMSIKKAGEYTLTVDFTKQIWDGSAWVDAGKTTQASVTFYIDGSSVGAVQTGDTTPFLTVAIIVVIAAIVLIAGIITFIRRRRSDV